MVNSQIVDESFMIMPFKYTHRGQIIVKSNVVLVFALYFPFKLLMLRLLNIKQIMQSTDNRQEELLSILKGGLFSIEPVITEVDRKLLSLAYTPGVGSICLDIQEDPTLSDLMTFRARAIAIVSNGSMLNSSGKQFMPVMDWFIYQIKHYTGLDAFPFVVSKTVDLNALLKDLSSTFGTVLYLDDEEIGVIPKNILFVRHQTIVSNTKSPVTNASHTSSAISYLIHEGIKGSPSEQEYKTASYSPFFKNVQNKQPFVFASEDLKENARSFHRQYQGKIQIALNFQQFTVALQLFTEQRLREIVKLPNVYSKTSRLSVIVTDGTAILGLGDIGPTAGLPVMEGKSLLFRLLGEVEVVPFCMYPRKTPEQQIEAIINSVGYFLAINLEDIKAPQCFDIETGLKSKHILPVFHDDQHGTAIVVLAALINSLKVAEKEIGDLKIVVNGAGAAGLTIAKLLISYGAKDVVVCDTKGAIYKGRQEGMNASKKALAQISNLHLLKGSLETIIAKSDIFVGVSAAGALKGEWIKSMNPKPIIFALANPTPEIMPDEAKINGAFIYGSGRSDFQNQINNSLVFPGIFRSIKEHNLKEITNDMKLKAAVALSKCLQKPASQSYVIPASLEKHLSVVISNEIGS